MSSNHPVLLYACFDVPAERWRRELRGALPELEIREWPDAGSLEEIDYVLTWNHPHGFLRQFPRVRAIFSLGAGVDRLLEDPQLPESTPLVRMLDPSLPVQMRQFVLMQTLYYHRGMPAYQAQQRAAVWRQLPPVPTSARRVGVMGMGQIGSQCAAGLCELGFDVRGWSRTPRDGGAVALMSGRAGLEAFLRDLSILICLLPLTQETRGILNLRTFSFLARGAYLIHLARGPHLVEQDLIAALDSGQLAGATLDVFATEPLPAEHPFWHDSRLILTPHVSALTIPQTAAARIALNIRRDLAGEPLLDVVDRKRGY